MYQIVDSINTSRDIGCAHCHILVEWLHNYKLYIACDITAVYLGAAVTRNCMSYLSAIYNVDGQSFLKDRFFDILDGLHRRHCVEIFREE